MLLFSETSRYIITSYRAPMCSSGCLIYFSLSHSKKNEINHLESWYKLVKHILQGADGLYLCLRALRGNLKMTTF